MAERVPAMEALLQSLEGVESVSIIPGQNGRIDEIHVLSQSGLEPKKVVRNVESALLAEAGVQVDHRVISVAQRRDEIPDGDRAAVVEGPASDGAEVDADRLLLRSVHLDRSAGRRISCEVTLEGAETYQGRASGMDHRNMRLNVVGKAVLSALREVTGDDRRALVLDSVEVVDGCGEEVVLALVHATENRRAVPLIGAALIEGSPEETAVLAVLDATNRWIGGR